jgi:hypothetical protein
MRTAAAILSTRFGSAIASISTILPAATVKPMLNTSAHAQGYAAYTFSGQPPEITDPRAAVGTSVQQDSIELAQRQLAGSR